MPELPLIAKIIIWAIPIIFAITVHEVAHGWVASQLGDQTAKMLGRLTLNPIKHVDPIGTIVVPLVMLTLTPYAFGWAKPVPVDWRNLHHPKRDMALVAIAGPGANLIMLIFWAILIKVCFTIDQSASLFNIVIFEMAQVGIIINIVLIVLNLIPLPPLDGSRVVSSLLPNKLAWYFNRLERWGLAILLVLIFTGVFGKVLGPVVGILNSFVYSLLSI